MAETASRSMWSTLLGGVGLLVLGIILVAWPGITLATLIYLFGFLILFAGIMYAVAALVRPAGHRLWAFVGGTLATVFGIIILVWPGLTALTLIYLIAIWALVAGVADLIAAFAAGIAGGQRILLVLIGLVQIVFGLIFLVHPGTGALAFLWAIGLYLIAVGILRIIGSLFGGGRTASSVRPAV
jgi:uncharacterized membrane protein HdeD (DUF308 family)